MGPIPGDAETATAGSLPSSLSSAKSEPKHVEVRNVRVSDSAIVCRQVHHFADMSTKTRPTGFF